MIIRNAGYCKGVCKKFTILRKREAEKEHNKAADGSFAEYPGQSGGRIGLDNGEGGWKNFDKALGGPGKFFGKVSVAFT